MTLVEAREHLAHKDAEEARKYLEHMDTLKSVHEHLRREANKPAQSLWEARIMALLPLMFAFLLILCVALAILR